MARRVRLVLESGSYAVYREPVQYAMNARSWVRSATASAVDRALGIHTASVEGMLTHEATLCQDSLRYDSAHPLTLLWFLRTLDLREDDTFYDIGCGAGRMVCLAARRKLNKVVGVEIDGTLSCLAEKNVKHLRGRKSPVAIVREDAAGVRYDDGTVFFMDNPFGVSTLTMVLETIHRSLESNPRFLRILYLHPVHNEAFERSGWLKFRGIFRPPWSGARASFWEAGATSGHS